jgi:hypothetical protein
MVSATKNGYAAAMFVLLLVPTAVILCALPTAAQPTSGEMTIRQVRRVVATGLKSAGTNPPTKISGIKFSESYVEFNVNETYVFKKFGACIETGRHQVDLRTLGTLTAKPLSKTSVSLLYMDGKALQSTVLNFSPWGSLCGKHPDILGIFSFPTENAQTFADAMNRLSSFARGGGRAQQEAEWRDFQQKAVAWRALAAKPPLAEEVRKERLLAEDALHEKQMDAAVEHYETGLDIDPCWPEGHFNAALLYAELREYSDAVQHMRAYLELAPDAQDAPQARDQIVIWEAKRK